MPQTTSRNPIRTILRAAATAMPTIARFALLALGALPGIAAAGDVAHLLDLPSEHRFVLTLGGSDSLGRPGAGVDRLVVDGPLGRPVLMRMPRAAMLHRFAAALVDAQGRPIAGPVEWSVTLGDEALSAVAFLTSARAQIGIPRPYGVRVEAGDELVVTARVSAGIDGASLRVTMDYDLPEPSATRLAARAVVARAEPREADERDAATLEWTWTATGADRLVAITAATMGGAAEIVVEDATTGAPVWRMRGPSRFASAAAQLGETVYPGVRLEAGRTYRLRVVRSADAGGSSAPDASTPASEGLPLLLLVTDTARR